MLILFVDTETCGFPNDRLPDDHPAQPPLAQLGCVLAEDNGAEWATLELIIRPNGKYRIPDSAAKIHGITTAIAETVGIPLSLAVAAYANLRSRADVLVFHNAKFDLRILDIAIAQNGKVPSHPGPTQIECTMEMSAPILNLPASDRMVKAGYGGKPKPPKLSELHQYLFNCDFEGAHGALADARAAMRCWFEIKRLEKEKAA